MCLATPVKVVKTDGRFAEIEENGHTHRVNVVLIPDLKVGDWIMAHGDLGVGKMTEEQAQEILTLASGCHHQH